MKRLGATFGDEVIAAGLGGLPFSWGTDGVFHGRESLTEQQNALLDTVIATHDPSRTRGAPTPQEKLAVLGLTVDDLKALLK